MIFCILGASNSGKTELLQEFVNAGSRRVLTSTTRERRDGEAEDAYDFVSREEFERRLSAGEMIEHVIYNGEYYGLSADAVSGDNCVIVMEPNGLRQLHKLYPGKVFSIYLNVPANVRIQRGLKRGDEQTTLESRVIEDEELFTSALTQEVDCMFNIPKRELYPLIASMCRAPFLKNKKGGDCVCFMER